MKKKNNDNNFLICAPPWSTEELRGGRSLPLWIISDQQCLKPVSKSPFPRVEITGTVLSSWQGGSNFTLLLAWCLKHMRQTNRRCTTKHRFLRFLTGNKCGSARASSLYCMSYIAWQKYCIRYINIATRLSRWKWMWQCPKSRWWEEEVVHLHTSLTNYAIPFLNNLGPTTIC